MRPLLASLISLASTLHAQDGSVRILVGFAPGRGADLIARLPAEKIKDAIGVDLQHVHYTGGAPMLNDLVGGTLAAGFDVLSEAVLPHRAGKVRTLATLGEKRSPMASDIPTFTEMGFPQIQGNGWFDFHARASTPPAMLEKLSATAIRAPDVNERLLAIAFEPVGSKAEGLRQRMREDRARWEPVVGASGYFAG